MSACAQKAALKLAACVFALLGCSTDAGTVRVYDGRSVRGPYIDAETYAAYAQASYLEARGDVARAEAVFRQVLRRDPDSPGVWTRVGALACQSDLKRALEAFDSAADTGRPYAPAWIARAQCLYSQGHPALALRSAERAIELDPTAAQPNLLIAQIHRELGRPELAKAWLFAWVLMDLEAGANWRELSRHAELLNAPDLTALLRARLEAGAERQSELDAAALARFNRDGVANAALEAAIDGDDADGVIELASAARLSNLEVAGLALERGAAGLASKQLWLLLRANPESGDAWALAVCAAAHAGDDRELQRLLRWPATGRAEHPPALNCVGELLRWWVGGGEASEFERARERAVPNVKTSGQM